jgi:hypothetical protein
MNESRQVKTLAFNILKRIIKRNSFFAGCPDETISCHAIAVTLSEVFDACRDISLALGSQLCAREMGPSVQSRQLLQCLSSCLLRRASTVGLLTHVIMPKKIDRTL